MEEIIYSEFWWDVEPGHPENSGCSVSGSVQGQSGRGFKHPGIVDISMVGTEFLKIPSKPYYSVNYYSYYIIKLLLKFVIFMNA